MRLPTTASDPKIMPKTLPIPRPLCSFAFGGALVTLCVAVVVRWCGVFVVVVRWCGVFVVVTWGVGDFVLVRGIGVIVVVPDAGDTEVVPFAVVVARFFVHLSKFWS